jgi:dienelactone hydrolase
MRRLILLIVILTGVSRPVLARADEPISLPGTRPLDWNGDLAARMVEGVDRFLLRKTAESVANRARHWNRDLSSPDAYARSIEPNRKRLAHILGVRDPLVPFDDWASAPISPNPAVETPIFGLTGQIDWRSFAWPVVGDIFVEGYMVMPRGEGKRNKAVVILIPDADTPPEALLGLVESPYSPGSVAVRLAGSGCRVLIPTLVDRTLAPRNGRAKLTNREFLQRPAFELGRTLPGYETQAVLAIVEHLGRPGKPDLPLGVAGFGEGGLIALHAAALDTRIDAALVSGAFDSRIDIWREPVERNVFGLLDQFGGAELASLVAPRPLVVEACAWPSVEVAPGNGGAPGRLATPPLADVGAELDRARPLIPPGSPLNLVASGDDGAGPPGSDAALAAFLRALDADLTLSPADDLPDPEAHDYTGGIAARQARLIHQLDRHTQQLLIESPYVRSAFMKNLDTSSPEAYAKSIEHYRETFERDVIGRFEDPLLPPDPRSRKIYETDKLAGYEVVLDVWPDVFAYGILVVPKDLKDGERRPVVVCQHGLEGRPRDVADPSVDNPAYNQYALRLAERGFVTFAPQNLYIGEDRFRTLQRKANPLGKTLFSVIVPQHRQITGWLKSLPFVDPDRIAFYGLSYGGKSAMRIPPLVPDYCLSICSADFNEWVWKNASTRSPYSYVWTGEYEIFEWDLGSTFNYAEMAALIAPRPFMVERGHFDGVAPDETVAYEFAKVRNLYAARLKLPPDHCQIEWFVGPHTIHGVGTFEFLHHHLNWPMRDDQPIVPLNKP